MKIVAASSVSMLAWKRRPTSWSRRSDSRSSRTPAVVAMQPTSRRGLYIRIECNGRPVSPGPLCAALRGQHLLDLAFDLLKVHELAVDGSEADVGHLVEVTQTVHHHLPDLP